MRLLVASGCAQVSSITNSWLETKPDKFIVYLPPYMISLSEMAIPGVWPLRGTVVAMKKHYYAAGLLAFPPPGCALEAHLREREREGQRARARERVSPKSGEHHRDERERERETRERERERDQRREGAQRLLAGRVALTLGAAG